MGRRHLDRRDQCGDHRRQPEGAARRAPEGILGARLLAGAVAADREGRPDALGVQRSQRRAGSRPSACPASSRRACRRRRCGHAVRRRRSATTTPRLCARRSTRLVDFDLINEKHVRLSVGAVNVRTGNFAYFDNANEKIGPEHIMASGALPPGFPPVEIDGEHYWDGGLVSNTPLDYVLDQREDRGPADLPGRPVQRPRAAAGLDPRGDRSARRTSATPAARG